MKQARKRYRTATTTSTSTVAELSLFHLMIGPNLFTLVKVQLDERRKVLRVGGRCGINRSMNIPLDEVEEIRPGLATDSWIELKSRLKLTNHDLKDVYHFSVVLRSAHALVPGPTVDLFTLDRHLYDRWFDRLSEVVRRCGQARALLLADHDTMLKSFYRTEIKQRLRDFRPHQHLRKFIHSLRINLTGDELDEVLDREYPHHVLSPENLRKATFLSRVTYGEFAGLMNKFDRRSGLDFVFYKYSLAGGSDFMTTEGLQRFFADQHTPKTEAECSSLISKYADHYQSARYSQLNDPSAKLSPLLTRRAFYRLFDQEPELGLFNPRHKSVCQAMDQPLAHYFIASSHNSYLSGNQITSNSSYEMYRRILLDGCRCLEIDVWNGATDSEPEVYHGHTITSRVRLRGVLETIAQCAFTTSDYPVILSIENHLNKAGQRSMAGMMRQIFKKRLYTDDVPEGQDRFPSPESLRGKIFIKGSKSELFKLPPPEGEETDVPSYRFMCLEFSFGARSRGAPNHPSKAHRRATKQYSVISGDFESDDDDIEEEEEGEDDVNEQTLNGEIEGNEDHQQQQQMLRRRQRRLKNLAIRRRPGYFSRELGRTTTRFGTNTSGGNDSRQTSDPSETEPLSRNDLSKVDSDTELNDQPSQHHFKHYNSTETSAAATATTDGIPLTKLRLGGSKHGPKPIDEDFSALINYFRTRKFKSIQDCLEQFKFYEMVSRDESSSKRIFNSDTTTTTNVLNTTAKDTTGETKTDENKDENSKTSTKYCASQRYRRFTSTNMVRVYPHAMRQDSSNYMPLDHWDVGAQMVALNYQTVSVPMLLNGAQFALNGRCGYVLEPEFLRRPAEPGVAIPQPSMFDVDTSLNILPKTILQVQVVCGQFWGLFSGERRLELKVSTRVYCPDKERRMDLKRPESTKVIERNGFNPVWNETFTFDLTNPELSFVQFTLVNSGRFVGAHMIAFQAMQRGYRWVGLVDQQLRQLPHARLYLHVDHWTEESRNS